MCTQGQEYTYDNVDARGGSGVIAHVPYYDDVERRRTLPLRCQLLLGSSRLSSRSSHQRLRSLGNLWLADDYDLLEHNCHHWCHAAAAALQVADPPPYVTRAPQLLRLCSGIQQSSSERQWRGGVKVAKRGSVGSSMAIAAKASSDDESGCAASHQVGARIVAAAGSGFDERHSSTSAGSDDEAEELAARRPLLSQGGAYV